MNVAVFEQLARLFQAGGWTMYPISLLNMLLLPSAFMFLLFGIFARKYELKFAVALLAGVFLTLVFAVYGHFEELRMVEGALSVADPSEVETMRNVGHAEARVPLIFGSLTATLPLAAALSLGALGWAKPRDFKSWLAALALGAGAALIGFGFMSYQIGLSTGERAAAVGDPNDVAVMLAAAEQEARTAKWTIFAGLIPLIAGAVLTTTRPRS